MKKQVSQCFQIPGMLLMEIQGQFISIVRNLKIMVILNIHLTIFTLESLSTKKDSSMRGESDTLLWVSE